VPSPDTKHFLYAASFSPSRPGVIAACSRSSQIHLFDLAESRVKPAFTVDRAGTEDSAVLCMGWSSSGASFATGDAKGCVRVWSVTSSLCETTELERYAMRYAERKLNNNNNNNSPGRNNNNNAASTNNAVSNPDGGEDDGRLGGFENGALTQSMLLAGRGAAMIDASSSGGAGGHQHVDPVQMLFGFTP
jgi:WD40 repeat protein